MKKFSWAILLTTLLSACISLGADLANLPVSFDKDQRVENIAYGPMRWQKLDLYYPKETPRQNLPVIVFFYGGSWQSGDKTDYAFVAERFTKLGYAVVIPDYIKYPLAKFPKFMEDAATSVAYVHKNAADLKLDTSRLYVMGHSAGAHMAALVATDPSYLKAAGGSRDWIAAVAGLAGPYAFTPEEEDMKAIFGPPSQYPKMQVPNFIDGKQPPMLLLHGDADATVGQFNLRKLEAAIREKGGVVETKIYPDISHISIVGSLSWIYRDKAPIAQDVDAFFKKY